VLYRVFQEALLNVAKHAHAATARVHAARNGRVLRLSIEDDGIGFDPAAPDLAEHGIGLFSMAERLALVDGTLHVHSAPGNGTAIVAGTAEWRVDAITVVSPMTMRAARPVCRRCSTRSGYRWW
jgi:two-component system nitrate/nitrite sensor histidine kinase NarX